MGGGYYNRLYKTECYVATHSLVSFLLPMINNTSNNEAQKLIFLIDRAEFPYFGCPRPTKDCRLFVEKHKKKYELLYTLMS